MLVENNGKIVMDTDPYSGENGHTIGSFLLSSNRKDTIYDLGVLLLRVSVINEILYT